MRTIAATLTSAALAIAAASAQAPASAPKTPGTPAAQTRPATAAKPAGLPRTADGHPDLQGNWTNATITPLERMRPNTPLVLTEEAARDEETRTAAAIEAREAPSNPNREAPPVGGEVRKSPNAEPTYLERVWQAGAGVVGGYNSFWVDPGDRVLRVDGQARSSILIDPPDGRVPAYTPEARARLAKAAETRKSQGTEYDHPELRPLGERCITSFGNNAGPPMLPNYFYNNSYTIVQSKDTIVILTEMVHDARIVRMNGTHPPPGMGRQNEALPLFDDARHTLERERDLRPEDARVRSALAIAYAGLGRMEDALREGQRGLDLSPLSKDAMVSPFRIEDMARVCVMAGQFDTALDHIERLLSIRSRFSTRLLELDPTWDPLRGHPRYRKLMDRYADQTSPAAAGKVRQPN